MVPFGVLRHPRMCAGHLGCTPDAPAVNEYGYDDSSTYVSNNKSAQLGNFSTDQWFPANSSTLIVNHALGFIKQAPAEPFYLNLWFHISHAPLNPSPEQLENFTVEEYCPWSGMSPLHVASNRVYERCPIQIFRASQHDADAQIGRLMDYIRSDDNLKTNTFVIMSGGTLQAYKLHRLIDSVVLPCDPYQR
jgi:hypothetical protein